VTPKFRFYSFDLSTGITDVFFLHVQNAQTHWSYSIRSDHSSLIVNLREVYVISVEVIIIDDRSDHFSILQTAAER